MASLANAPRQLAGIWSQLGINQKVSILLVGLGSAAALVALVSWGGRQSYGLLYSGLSRKDAASVVSQLEAEGMSYRLEEGGTTVLVPSDRVQATRGKLLSEGVPSGGDGFEILDKGSLGLTEFAERKKYLRAVQGELARTIGCVEPVEWARVHLTTPEPSVFLDQEQPATASVLLKLRHGGQLDPGQVAAIAAFVARSTEGLKPENVTITDQYLNPLSRQAGDRGLGSASAHLIAQREIEKHFTRKVQDMLDASLGPGRSSVSVCADVTLKQEETRDLQFDEEGRVAKRESSTTSKTTGGSEGADGPAGSASNLPGRGGATRASGEPRNSTESSEEMEYEVPRTEVVRVDNSVTLDRLTVSVLVAGTYTTEEGEDGEQARTFQPLPQEEMTKLTEAVKQAVGYDESRNDIVNVDCVEFSQPTPAVTDEEVASERQRGFILRVARHGSTAVVIVAFLLVVRSMRRRARAAREAAEAQAREAQAAEQQRRAAQGAPLHERVASAVHSDPDAASELLKAWYKGAEAPSEARAGSPT
ncbi:MAG: flagellar basal-body MS-ring/collar protein FliF [Candidatus Brocadiia bacterium]